MKYWLAFAISLFCVQALGDSWSAAQVMVVASPTGKTIVRIVPGSNMDAVFGFAGSKKGESATATYYRLNPAANYEKQQKISLLNPIAPVYAAVLDSGELVTLDNWHNVGIGKSAVAVYSSDGRLLRSYSLLDMYKTTEIEKFRRTTSSIWWRCDSPPKLALESEVLVFEDSLGARVDINLKTGLIARQPNWRVACRDAI